MIRDISWYSTDSKRDASYLPEFISYLNKNGELISSSPSSSHSSIVLQYKISGRVIRVECDKSRENFYGFDIEATNPYGTNGGIEGIVKRFPFIGEIVKRGKTFVLADQGVGVSKPIDVDQRLRDIRCAGRISGERMQTRMTGGI